jgi:hypothetical protein
LLITTTVDQAQVAEADRPALFSQGFTAADIKDATTVLRTLSQAPAFNPWLKCMARSISFVLAANTDSQTRPLSGLYCLEREETLQTRLAAGDDAVRAGRIMALLKADWRMNVEQALARRDMNKARPLPPAAVHASHPPLPEQERSGSWRFRPSKGACVAGLTYDDKTLPSVLVSTKDSGTAFAFVPEVAVEADAKTTRRRVTCFSGTREANRMIDSLIVRKNGITALDFTLSRAEAELLGGVSAMWIAGAPDTAAATTGEFFFPPRFFFAISGTRDC